MTQGIVLFLVPTDKTSCTYVNFMLRERTLESENINLEVAYDEIENNIMSDYGGILWDKFRTQKQLVYSYSFVEDDLTTSKFKHFIFQTSGAKVKQVIKQICSTIKDIADNGIDKQLFEDMKTAYLTAVKQKMLKFPSPNASNNLDTFLYNEYFIDYDKVCNYIKNMTYEDFNRHIQEIYRQANPSLIVTGDFDTRKCYNLLEIEQMLGKNINKDKKALYNPPKIEQTIMTLPENEAKTWEELDKQLQQYAGGYDEHDLTTLESEEKKDFEDDEEEY